MATQNVSPQLIAGGDIRPSRFVKVSGVADNTALEADANEVIIGISQAGTRDAPGLTGTSANAAVAGDPVQIFGLGDVCLLTIGSGGCTSGDRLKSDADGKGIPIAGTGGNQNVGAIALETCGENELCRVQIVISSMDPDEEDDANFSDDQPLYFGTTDDAGLLWSTQDASAHALVLALGDSNGALHITDKAARATDWNVSAETDTTIYLHSNTTPATDYLRIGAHTGSAAWGADMVGGATLNFGFDGLEALVLAETASAINHILITNAAMSGAPDIKATGDDTNVGMTITTKGAGDITVTAGNDVALQSGTSASDLVGLYAYDVDGTAYKAMVLCTAGNTPSVQLGTAAADLVGFYDVTGVAQYATEGTVTGFTAGTGTAVNDDSTFTGNTGTKAYTVGDVVRCLKLVGLMDV